MSRFIVTMTNQVERIDVSHYATMNNKTSVKHNWRCFKSLSVIGRIESVRAQSDEVLKIQKINTMCGRASLRKLRSPAKGGWRADSVMDLHTTGAGRYTFYPAFQKDFPIASDIKMGSCVLQCDCITVLRSTLMDSTATGQLCVCILWREMSCPVYVAWHSSVGSHWPKYFCYKQAPSWYDLSCLSKVNPPPQKIDRGWDDDFEWNILNCFYMLFFLLDNRFILDWYFNNWFNIYMTIYVCYLKIYVN